MLPHLMRPPSPEAEIIEGHMREKLHISEWESEQQNVQYRTVEEHDMEQHRLMLEASENGVAAATAPRHQVIAQGQRERERLPIDDYKEAILNSIEQSSVTCVHGETGCGKSSIVGAPFHVLACCPGAHLKDSPATKFAGFLVGHGHDC